MKMMKRIIVVLSALGIVVSLSGCSKADLPQEYNPVEAVTKEGEVAKDETKVDASKGETQVATQTSTTEEKKEGPVLVMIAAAADYKIEGSEGLAFYGVYADGDDDVAVKSAMEAGHFFATQAETGPTIKATISEAMMGDTVAFKEGSKIKVDIKGMKSGSILKVVNGENIIFEEKIMGDKITKRVEVSEKGAYRVEVHTADGQVVAISSSITFE